MNRTTRRAAIIAAILFGTAFGLRFGVAPALLELPADYHFETRYESEGAFRERPEDPLEWVPQSAVRLDETLLTSGGARIVQSSTSWFKGDGALTYESSGVYAVDSATRANVPELGDSPRQGQFLFPRHVGRDPFILWDAYYIGPRRASFVREDTLDGLPVLVFDVVAENINDTVAYEFLPSVPERYHIRTSGHTTIWVEPVSGLVVDVHDQGKSMFIDPETATPAGTVSAWRTWEQHGERRRLLAAARTERVKLLAVEQWLPLVALAGAVFASAAGLRQLRRPHVAAPLPA